MIKVIVLKRNEDIPKGVITLTPLIQKHDDNDHVIFSENELEDYEHFLSELEKQNVFSYETFQYESRFHYILARIFL